MISRKITHIASIAGATLLLLSSCRGASVPESYTQLADEAVITPDYTSTTIPCNIAPLRFSIDSDAEAYTTHFYTAANPEGIVVEGKTAAAPVDEWHKLVGEAYGDTLYADIYLRRDGKWHKYPTIANAVADSIDSYISYRLIEPSYVGYETLAICQRNLENFDENEIFNSQALSVSDEGQCMNCHSYQDYNRTGNMQMHFRQRNGGTVIVHNGEVKKINLKTDSTISSGVYPSWHPTLPIIAYSTNNTTQSFHTNHPDKIEVQDSESDLILYDVNNDCISYISHGVDDLETFPYWHPDGKSLWYVSAHLPHFETEKEVKLYENQHFQDFKYDIFRRSFDEATMTFGEPDTIFMASAYGKSATLPRPSPDGRYLLFTMAPYGTFHIWHSDADLYLMDLADGSIRPLDEVNSDDVESYHSWSSNGRWIIFSSRRDDGSYTRLYMAYFDRDGKAHKPFKLPQSTADHDMQRMKSYNIPEFMVAPAKVAKKSLSDALRGDARQVTM